MTDDEIIRECHREIQRLRAVVRELEAEQREANTLEGKAKHLLQLIYEMLPNEPRSSDPRDDPGFWTDGKSIFCADVTSRVIVADFLADILRGYITATVSTGSCDEAEDRRSGTVDGHTGFHYVTIE